MKKIRGLGRKSLIQLFMAFLLLTFLKAFNFVVEFPSSFNRMSRNGAFENVIHKKNKKNYFTMAH